MSLIYFPIVISLFAIVSAVYLFSQTRKFSAVEDGDTAVKATRDEAFLHIKKHYKAIIVLTIIAFVLLLGVPFGSGWKVSLGFLIGIVFSFIYWFLAIILSGRKNSGIIVSLMALGISLLGVSVYYLFIKDILGMIALLFGTVLFSAFVKIGNKATDCVAVAHDFFENCSTITVISMVLGTILFPRSPQFILLPLVLVSAFILILVIGISLKTFNKTFLITLILFVISFYFIIAKLMVNQAISVVNLYFSILFGSMAVIVMFFSVEKFKSDIQLKIIPVLLIILALFISFWLAGVYGIALMALGAVLTSAVIFLISVLEFPVAVVSSEILALALFFTYSEQVGVRGFLEKIINDPKTIIGLLIGIVLACSYLYFFKKLNIKGKIAIIFLTPILVGYVLGPKAIGGMLLSAIAIIVLFDILIKNKNSIWLETNSLIKSISATSLLIIGFLV